MLDLILAGSDIVHKIRLVIISRREEAVAEAVGTGEGIEMTDVGENRQQQFHSQPQVQQQQQQQLIVQSQPQIPQQRLQRY